MTRRFVDDRHALYVGWVMGIALRNGVPATAVIDDDGNYTDRIEIPWGELGSLTVVVPPPPGDWVVP